jgi:nucleoside-diphosphate-sugar epimerase
MERRDFLRNAGLLFANAAGTSGSSTEQAPASKSIESQNKRQNKRVLITSANCRLAQSLAAELSREYQVRLTERIGVKSSYEFDQCAMGNDASTRSLVRGTGAIVHVAEPLPDEMESQQIDYLTRCTYNLLWAAVEEGVRRLVLLSTLELMTRYDESFTVSERWRPLPTCEPRLLSKHLGEFTCREFAREGKIDAIVLRLGKVVRSDEVKGQPFDPIWVDERDVAQAVSSALSAKLADSPSGVGGWSIFHIGADSPRARFAVANAKNGLGYRPQFSW